MYIRSTLANLTANHRTDTTIQTLFTKGGVWCGRHESNNYGDDDDEHNNGDGEDVAERIVAPRPRANLISWKFGITGRNSRHYVAGHNGE